MKELIKISEGNGKRAVSARELHLFLESKQDFSNWINNRIIKYGFIQNQDFEIFNKFIENPSGGRPRIEYALSMDMAKELAMVEGNEKGKEARRYFIECERLAQNPTHNISRIDLAQMVIESEREKQRLQIQNDLQAEQLIKSAPKVEYFDEVLQSKDTYTTNQIAKELGMSAITLNKQLHTLGIQYKQSDTWLLYHRYQNKGYTKTKTHTYTDKYGQHCSNMQTVWTELGRAFIHYKIKNAISKISNGLLTT